MENILILLAVSIIAALIERSNKKRKAEQRKGSTSSTNDKKNIKDIFKELMESEDSWPVPAPSTANIPSKKAVEHTPIKKESADYSFSGLENSKEFDYLKKPKKQPNSIQEKINRHKEKENNSLKEHGSDINELLENFDVKKAIIYAEIMNPKFKAYQ